MACASDSSDSDQNIGPSKNHGFSNKRRVYSSEEETKLCIDTPSSATNNGAGSRRHSLRKRRKFQMPSREEQWSSIPSQSTVSNKLSQLKPRKLINDFMRVTHRYNYDYEEVSGEESMEEFIKGTDSSDSSDSSTTQQQGRTKQKGHRVKGYKPRIVKLSDDSSEEDQPDSTKSQSDSKTQLGNHPDMTAVSVEASNQQSKHKNKKKQKTFTKLKGSHSKETNTQCTQGQPSVSSDEYSQLLSHMKKARRKSVLDSDSDDHEQSVSPDDSPKFETRKNQRKPSVLNSGSDSDIPQPPVLSDGEDSQDIRTSSRKTRKKSARLSDSDSGEKDTTQTPTSDGASTNKEPTDTTPSDPKGDKMSKMPVNSSGKEPPILTVGSRAKQDSICSGDSAITIDDSESSLTDEDSDNALTDEDNSQDSSDNMDSVGRIQKLAEKKRQKRDSMFDQLKSIREKRQKKI